MKPWGTEPLPFLRPLSEREYRASYIAPWESPGLMIVAGLILAAFIAFFWPG